MFKVLFISHRFYPEIGGIETNAEILATGFCNLGANVHLITWSKSNDDKTFPFTVIRVPSLKKLLDEHHWADVILENNPSLRLSWPNLFIKKPLVIALNTWVTRLSGEKGFKDKLKQLWFKRAKTMIAVSDAVRRKEWPYAVVIENPYNDKLFKVQPNVNKQIPFVFLGRLVSDKGADQAIKAIAILLHEKVLTNDRIQLTIIGDGPEKENLFRLAEKLHLNSVIQFTGALQYEKLVSCLNQHKYILVPSSWEEPYGNIVLEGMACGCVPIVSDGGGLPEAVGDAGFTFKRNDIAAMVTIIENIFENHLQTISVEQGRVAHLENHSMDKVSKSYLTILELAASKN